MAAVVPVNAACAYPRSATATKVIDPATHTASRVERRLESDAGREVDVPRIAPNSFRVDE
jgi:hypothetical protein